MPPSKSSKIPRLAARPTPAEQAQLAIEAAAQDRLTPTARAILDVAERLFAQQGIERVSFRDLGAASGQRNVSAVAYHFGTREGLLGALLSRRLWLTNQLHLQRMQLLTRLGKANDPHAVISESIRVTSDAVMTEPWAAHFVTVMAQVLFHPELDVHKLVPPELMGGVEMAKRMIRGALPNLSEELFNYRTDLAHQGCYFTLSLWLRNHGGVASGNEQAYETFVSHTVDFLVGGLMAPAVSGADGRRADAARSRP